MDVNIFPLIFAFAVLFDVIQSSENKVKFVYKGKTGFKEELVITNVTSDENLELGHGVRKWKSMTLDDKNYAIGMSDIGIRLLTTRGENYTSKNVSITDNTKKLLDVQLHKVWNGASYNFEPVVLVLLDDGSLRCFKTNDNLELEAFWEIELDRDAFQFSLYRIDNVDYLLALKRSTEETAVNLDVFKISVTNSRYRYLWPEQTIKLEVLTTSFTLNIQASDYYLSIAQQQLNHVKIYKRVERSFQLQWKISNTDADTLQSFSIGPKTYLLTNGKNSGIYRITTQGPIKENLNESNVTNWLPIPLVTYRDEMFLLVQKGIDHKSHSSHSMELIHSAGFNFNVYHHEFPCVYYENKFHGLDCLVEEDDHHVELNLSAVIPFENSLGLIISRRDFNSQLFILNVDVIPIPNPKEMRIKRFQEMKGYLERMQMQISELKAAKQKTLKLKTSGVKTTKAREHRQRTKDELKEQFDTIKETIATLREVMTDWKEKKGIKIKKLIVNGNVKIEGAANIANAKTKKLNDDTLHAIRDIVQINHPRKIQGKKTFRNISIENIIFDSLNDIDKNQLIFNDNHTSITLKGNVEFIDGLVVTENITTASNQVNNISLNDELVFFEKIHDTVAIDAIEITGNLEVNKINSLPVNENLALNSNNTINDYFANKTFANLNLENLSVDRVNSENVTEILQNIVLKNLNYSFPTTLEIDVLNTSNARINLLNDLTFPDDYIFVNATNNAHISGYKKFDGEIIIKSLTVDGLVNGIKTSDIFTLSGNQNITGTIDFQHLEIIDESFGSSRVLKPNDIVNQLKVEGSIMVEQNINNVNIDSYLDNLLWKNSENVDIINSTKIFKQLSTDNFYVNTINNNTANSYVNKFENQTFNVDMLQGNVIIEKLYVQGKINDVHVKDLLEDSVKLSENQNISSFLMFSDLEVNNLDILETLNGLSPNDYLHADGEKYLTLQKLKNINASKVVVNGEVFGKIDGLDIDEFQSKALKINGSQRISGDVHVDELHVGYLNVGRINGYYTRELFDADYYKSLMESMILQAKVAMKSLTIQGNFTFESINNISMKDVMSSLTFTKGNDLQPNITFRDNVSFNGVKVNNFNNIPFKDLVDNLIFKNETNVKINSSKIFMHGFEVNNYIETSSLNEILLENVLRKENVQRINGPIIINGNITIEDDVELVNLNDVPMEELKHLVNVSGDTILLNRDVLFNQSAHINDLIFEGYFNGKNFTEVVAHAVGLRDDAAPKGHFTFTNKVYLKKDFDVSGTFNDINLSKTYKDIVFLNEDDYIEGLVSFKELVEVKGMINVESDLLTNTIMGINPHDWYRYGVFINNGFIPGKLKFQNITVLNAITTKFFNNMNASRFVSSQIDQTIKDDLIIQNMKVNDYIYVKGLVNGLELYPEYLNTVQNHGIQNITSKVRFNGNVVVYEDLFIREKVNNFDFDKIVFTNHAQNLSGSYEFLTNITAPNLEVLGLVNGINFTDWYKNSLKKNRNQTQTIEKPISMKNLIIENYSHGPGLISGLNLRNVTDNMAYKLQYKSKREKDLITDYKGVCADVNNLLHASKKQIYKFKYLEFSSSIDFEKYIHFVFYFKHAGQHYLLVNEKNSCDSHILQWNHHAFVEIQNFETGVLEQTIAVKSEGIQTYIVGISSSCTTHKTNLWSLQQNFTKNHQILEDFILLHESQIPNTFYALTQYEVREYKITADFNVHIYMKWGTTTNYNMAFVPRGLKTGPALRDGQNIIKLQRNDEGDVDFNYDIQETLLGKTSAETNKIIPGRNDEMVVLNVGKQKKIMVAISSREGSSVKTKSDSIKIYSDVFKGTLFHKIPTYKPSSITSLELGNGETFLLFLEDQRELQVYAYKGIEGFQHINSAKIRAQQIMKMKLPADDDHFQDALVVVNRNELSLLKVVVDGYDSTNVEEMLCEL